ncbi:Hypothetical predicted protein [Marmota monax]|uniref:PH domain-containing protein n=1 Tax=Marmota monax TaxID=9995 RepID=A0A5E4CRH1_MARMO|nr:Hypothetical predicted protein [Marmota monax]
MSRLQAWRRRWFILRNSQESIDPAVLEYYKHDQSKKPLRIINLDLCEQVHAYVTFHEKGLPGGFVFDVQTRDRTFYLVAQTNEDMHKWVQSICQVCGFQRLVQSKDSLTNDSSASQHPIPSSAKLNRSCQQHLQENRRSTLAHCRKPTLITCSSSDGEEGQPMWSSRAPQEFLHQYLHLDQCMSHGPQSAR